MTLTRPSRHPAADRGGLVDWSEVRRILAVRADNLGDVVMLSPALRALRAAAPGAGLDLLASPAGAAAAPMLGTVDDVLPVSVSWQDAGPPGYAARLAAEEQDLVHRIRGRGYDVLLVFTSARQSPWPAAHVGLLAGVPVRAVHSTEFGGAVATHWVAPPPEGTHQVDRALHLLAALGVAPVGRELELLVPATTAVDRVLAAVDRPFAVLAPGASCPSKRYPAARFAVAARLLAGHGRTVLVAGSERERALVRSVVDGAAHPSVTELEPVDVPTLTAVIQRAEVVLCNNSACLHLADAVRTPVVVTYAGTERLTDMPPRSTRARLLRRAVPCSPCRQFHCPYQQQCLDLPPAEVAAAAARLAGATGTAVRVSSA